MSIAAITAATAAVEPAVSMIINVAKTLFDRTIDPSSNSLTSYAKTGRISSRVYIDASVASDPVITDVLKTVHTQYCAFILAALQMSQLVTAGVTVQDLLKVVATEDYQQHQDIASSFGVDSDRVSADNKKHNVPPFIKPKEEKPNATPPFIKPDTTKKPGVKSTGTTGEVVSFAGDNHIPAGKVIEITMANPANPEHKVVLNILVQLAPYLVPEELAVQFIVKDNVPSFYQRYIQWKTGEISFWKDLIAGDDIVRNREKLLKLDPTGLFADMMSDQQNSRFKSALNYAKDKDSRARNIANAVLIFSQDTVTRAKAETGMDFNDFASRQRYFATTFAMMIIIVDVLYNQVTFYYNGIQDVGTFSFDQMRISGKGGSSMDVVSVMNALSQGKSPKF